MQKVKFKNRGAYGSFPARKRPQFNAIVPFSVPKYVEWLSPMSDEKEDFYFFFDETLRDGLQFKSLKFGYLFESEPYLQGKGIWGWIVDDLIKNQELYKKHYMYIFTCWKDLLDLGAPFAYRPAGGSKLREDEKKIYDKTKLVSMFVSDSNVLPGHIKRLSYKDKYKHCMDVYGRGINPLSDIDYILGYRDYMFTVAFDNCNVDYQFSEKLIDPILTAAVPVYDGSKGAAEKYFDTRGILWADEINPEKDLSKELYESMLPYIRDNFNAALEMPTIEDYIYLNYLKEIK